MRTLYWDCFAGISGDTALASLIDAGAAPQQLQAMLAGLPLAGWTLEIRNEHRSGIRSTKVEVRMTENQPPRRLPDILKVISAGGLPESVSEMSARVFKRLAEAEAGIHGTAPDQVHFHEVGALDAIIEVVGCVAALQLLNVQRVEISPFPLSRGFVQCAHGLLPVPAPAVLELIRGFPTRRTDIEGELVTPTGAALAVTLAASAGPIPGLVIDRVGYGAGTTVFPFPNVLRAILGRAEPVEAGEHDRIVVLETTLDDVIPEHYPYFLERLRDFGAKDAYLTPLVMKKGRPGIKLTALAGKDDWKKLLMVIIKETGTLGVRVRREDRVVLERKLLQVETAFGPVRVKAALQNGTVLKVKPEFEDCRVLALRHGIPIRIVTAEAEKVAYVECKADIQFGAADRDVTGNREPEF